VARSANDAQARTANKSAVTIVRGSGGNAGKPGTAQDLEIGDKAGISQA
jgi:hypothetical protein